MHLWIVDRLTFQQIDRFSQPASQARRGTEAIINVINDDARALLVASSLQTSMALFNVRKQLLNPETPCQ